MINPHPTPPLSREASWGGVVLAVGATLYTAAILLYLGGYGRPSGTGPGGAITPADTAAHVQAHWPLVRFIWLVEMAGGLLMGLAGSVLRTRRARSAGAAGRLAWSAVGLGAIVLAIMNAFIAGSYGIAAAAFPREPGLLAALQGGATVWFYAGSSVLLAGLAMVFAIEGSAPDRVVPKPVAWLGALVAGVGALDAAALLAGIGSLMLAGVSALLGYPLAAVLGVALWRTTDREHPDPGLLAGRSGQG